RGRRPLRRTDALHRHPRAGRRTSPAQPAGDRRTGVTAAVCGALLAVVIFAVTAPRLGRHLPPALATRLLVPTTLVMAAATVIVLGLLASAWLAQLPPIAAMGTWSASRLDAY